MILKRNRIEIHVETFGNHLSNASIRLKTINKGQGANVTGYPGKASMAENGQDRNSNQEVKTTDEQN